MNFRTKLAAGVGGALLAVAPALASVNITGSNNTTGSHSDNSNSVSVTQNTNVDVNNHSKVNNDINFWANTGHNNSNKNTVGGEISTGDVNVMADINNVANGSFGFDLFDLTNGDVSANFANGITGANSNNYNSLALNQSNSINVRNNSWVDNDINFKANTGHNNSNKNTVGGSVMTGDVTANFSLSNKSGGGLDLSGMGMGASSVSVSGSNNTTGASSNNSNSVQVTQSNSVNVSNCSSVDNNVHINANTGNNNSNGNTQGGSISTGDVNASVSISNTSN
jgi:hypothetical protein